MGKVVNIEETKFLNILNSFPKEYNITVTRNESKFNSMTEWDSEAITWEVKEPALDNEIGDVLVFNHMLTIVDSLISENPTLMAEFLAYIEELGVTDDSNFNK